MLQNGPQTLSEQDSEKRRLCSHWRYTTCREAGHLSSLESIILFLDWSCLCSREWCVNLNFAVFAKQNKSDNAEGTE